MKREEIKAIFSEATDEQLDKVLGINGADIEAIKKKISALENDLKAKDETLARVTNDFDTLKSKNADAEDYKSKFESLQKEIAEKEKQAKADAESRKKAESILSRFNTAVGEKKFNHEAIKADYLKKFGEALESKDFEGKSDADIFHELTKDDASAFKGVTAFKLEGGSGKSLGMNFDDEKVRSVMGLPTNKN